jgi:hypothetical protein
MATQTSKSTTCHQQVYGCLIIREALRHGGVGWLNYDRAFHQQAAAADPSLRLNTLLPGLQASTMLGHGSGQGTLFCTLCQEAGEMCTPVHKPANATDRQNSNTAEWTILYACHGIEEPASSQEIVHTSTCVQSASVHTRLKIV